MKKLLILFILSIFLLGGCNGIYNLNHFTLPDDTEFLACIEALDTPQKIGDYMLENFTYEKNNSYTPDPYTLWKTEKGDCNDFSTFGMFIANYHCYETYLIRIYYKDYAFSHCLAIYKENGFYNFSDNQYYFPVSYNNFFNIVKFDSQWMYDFNGYIWSSYVVYDYDNNLIEQGINN